MEQLKKYILSQVSKNLLPIDQAKEYLRELTEANKKTDFAIIGMSGKFAGADSVEEYWDIIAKKKNAIRKYPKARLEDLDNLLQNKCYAEFMGMSSKRPRDSSKILNDGGYLNELDKFDSYFFNISPVEALNMDPYQRISLETSWLTIEDAGYNPESIKGKNVGVFLGRDMTNISYYKQASEPNQMLLTGTWESLTASRISYVFDFKGPSMVIDTACSSGLVSIHMAIQSMLMGECDLAIAGGINLSLFGEIKSEYAYAANLENVESHDNTVRTFDARANGTLWSEGVGLVLLKPLSQAIKDRDNIQAVIKASEINNDGASNSITAPNAKTQQELIIKTWKKAKIDPETIGFIEAHGTGTILGDPIEIKGLTNAFKTFTDKRQFCAVGSSKTNYGHMVAAAGVGALVKAVKALQKKQLPPNINFEVPNPYINFIESPLYINDELKEWQSVGVRRAAISSFGFSRTNCHVLLEEAPEIKLSSESDSYRLLTVSAKTIDSLKRYVLRFRNFVEETSESFDNICYTSSIGREHYQYRAVFLARNKKELVHELNLATCNNESEYYCLGEHHIRGNHEQDLLENHLTLKAQEALTDRANRIIKSYLKGSSEEIPVLKEIISLYVKGADIPWRLFYKNEERKRISIPTYPFEKNRYWANVKPSQVKVTQEHLHPLVHRKSYEDEGIMVFETVLDNEVNWELHDHKINGITVLPGTSYLEMVYFIAKNFLSYEIVSLENVFFLSPLVLDEENCVTVTIHISDRKKIPYFSIFSQDKDGNKVSHIEGRIISGVEKESVNKLNIQEIFKRPFVKETNILLEDEQEIFTFGKHWDIIKAIWNSKELTIGRLELHEELEYELEDYKLHPSILDNAVNLISQQNKKTYLPFSYKRLTVYRGMPKKIYTFLSPLYNKDISGETITFDITLSDEDGNIIASIDHYVIKQVHQIRNLTKPKRRSMVLNWIPEKRLEKVNEDSKVHKWILVSFEGEKALSLKQEMDRRNVEYSTLYLPRVNKGEEFPVLTQVEKISLMLEGGEFTGIILAVDIDSLYIGYHDRLLFNLYKQMTIDLLVYLIKDLLCKKLTLHGGIKIIVKEAHAVNFMEQNLNPVGTAMTALGTVIGKEYRHIPVSIIDIDEETRSTDLVSEIIADGLSGISSLRAGQRFVPELDYGECHFEDELRAEQSGVFLVSGGLGGIGFEISKRLSNNGKNKVIIIGRQNLMTDSSENQERLNLKFKKLQSLEERNENVEYIAADITDPVKISELKQYLIHKYGKIDGIYHAAGIAGEGFLMNKPIEVFSSVINPKMIGTINMLSLISENKEGFMVLFSSINAITGEEGQSDYSAANAFMDMLAFAERKRGKHIINCNWPAWKNVGMAQEYQINERDSLFAFIDLEEGLNLLDTLTAKEWDIPQVFIPADINISLMQKTREDLPFRLSEKIMNRFSDKTADNQNQQKKELRQVYMKGLSNPDSTLIKLSNIFGDVLGLTEIDVNLSFQELGGNSLMATQLLRTIEEYYSNMIDISDIFSYPSIIELSNYIKEKESKNEEVRDEDGISDEVLDYLKHELDDINILEVLSDN